MGGVFIASMVFHCNVSRSIAVTLPNNHHTSTKRSWRFTLNEFEWLTILPLKEAIPHTIKHQNIVDQQANSQTPKAQKQQ